MKKITLYSILIVAISLSACQEDISTNKTTIENRYNKYVDLNQEYGKDVSFMGEKYLQDYFSKMDESEFENELANYRVKLETEKSNYLKKAKRLRTFFVEFSQANSKEVERSILHNYCDILFPSCEQFESTYAMNEHSLHSSLKAKCMKMEKETLNIDEWNNAQLLELLSGKWADDETKSSM